ncbi:hypothetical protein BTVI_13531 [Pitangus sulphuratus]|nr:hypothetical protein BTVI_13531 [Pitangus sulphuratus]
MDFSSMFSGPRGGLIPYAIHRRILKELADVIVRSLSMISKWSWESGEVLVYWKLAQPPLNTIKLEDKLWKIREEERERELVAPGVSSPLPHLFSTTICCLPATGDWNSASLERTETPCATCDDPGNYRPVSLTSVTGKIMEKIILRVIEKHLKDNAVIGQSQHSFMRGKSCLSNLISLYEKDPSGQNVQYTTG